MTQTFKQEVDRYFTKQYDQLESTVTKMVAKYRSKIEPANLLSLAYLYVASREEDVSRKMEEFHQTAEHVIYSFTLKYIRDAFSYSNAQINIEENRLFGKVQRLDTMFDNLPDHMEEHDMVPLSYTAEQQDDIYNDDFIAQFASTLDKQDGICFRVYYNDGIDNAKDFARHFDISLSSAYTTINSLKDKLKQYIQKNKIH